MGCLQPIESHYWQQKLLIHHFPASEYSFLILTHRHQQPRPPTDCLLVLQQRLNNRLIRDHYKPAPLLTHHSHYPIQIGP